MGKKWQVYLELREYLKNLPAFWAGGTYDQAFDGTAKTIIRHDGTSKFTGEVISEHEDGSKTILDNEGLRVLNQNGNMNIRFGLKNGFAVMEYYDNDGVLLYDLGPQGIVKIENRPSEWFPIMLLKVADSVVDALSLNYRDRYKNPINYMYDGVYCIYVLVRYILWKPYKPRNIIKKCSLVKILILH